MFKARTLAITGSTCILQGKQTVKIYVDYEPILLRDVKGAKTLRGIKIVKFYSNFEIGSLKFLPSWETKNCTKVWHVGILTEGNMNVVCKIKSVMDYYRYDELERNFILLC